MALQSGSNPGTLVWLKVPPEDECSKVVGLFENWEYCLCSMHQTRDNTSLWHYNSGSSVDYRKIQNYLFQWICLA